MVFFLLFLCKSNIEEESGITTIQPKGLFEYKQYILLACSADFMLQYCQFIGLSAGYEGNSCPILSRSSSVFYLSTQGHSHFVHPKENPGNINWNQGWSFTVS